MSTKSIELKSSHYYELPLTHIRRCLVDMRCWRAVLNTARFMDPRHYGPSDGLGARIAVVIDHMQIRRSGVVMVQEAEGNEQRAHVKLSGEFPPIDYVLDFELEKKDGGTSLSTTITANPQKLFFYRFRTKKRLSQQLPGELPILFDGLMERFAEQFNQRSLDAPRHPRVTTDGFVEGAASDVLTEGKGTPLTYLDRDVAIFMVDGTAYALPNEFPEKGTLLVDGHLEGFTLTSPSSGNQFDIRTGACVTNPETSLPIYPCRQEDGRLYVRIQLQ